MRRMNNLKNLFMSYTTDSEDRQLLYSIRSDVLKSASVLSRLRRLADRLDQKGLFKEANMVDKLIPSLAEASSLL